MSRIGAQIFTDVSMCPFHWRRIMFVCRYIYAFIFCVIFKNSCHNTLFNFVSIFPHVSQSELKFLIAVIFLLDFHLIIAISYLVARDLRCQKTSFIVLQRFFFDYLEFSSFWKKNPFMTIIFPWTIQLRHASFSHSELLFFGKAFLSPLFRNCLFLETIAIEITL